MNCLSLPQEIDRILAEYDGKMSEIMAMLERQFVVLHNRAQVLLTLCGIVISTTGFSGRLVAGTNETAQAFVIAGVGLILLAAIVCSWGVLHLRWLTMQKGQDIRQWLESSLRYRNLKTTSYRVAVIIMLFGLTTYCVALAIMLAYPHENALPAR
jgi:steroid 5-alpha reductase family enzyme